MIRSAVIFVVSCLLLAVGMSPAGAMCLPWESSPAVHPDATSILSGHTWLPPTAETIFYDESGNRRSTSLWTYRWNSRNQLVTATTKDIAGSPEGWRVTFDYDAEGRRFKKQVIHKTTADAVAATTIENIYFIWDGWNLIYERHENQYGMRLWDRQYIWGEDLAGGMDGAEGCGGAGALLLIRDHRDMTDAAAYTDYYPCFDTSGHLIALTDPAGAVVATYDYGPFGEQIQATGPAAAANPWRYATKYLDSETGLYYFGRRYYDPVTAQWLSRELLGEGESLNLYSYCHNDPVNSIDVLGLRERTIVDPNDSTRFRRGADRGWEVHLLTEKIGFLDGFFGRQDRTITGGEYVSVTHPAARDRIAGYAEFNCQGGIPGEGSRLIQRTFQIAEEEYHLSTHAKIGQAAMGIYGVALAAPGLVVAAPEVAGMAAEGYFVAGVRGGVLLESAAPVLSRLGAAGTLTFVYGAAHDQDTAAMALSSPTAMDDIGVGLNGFRYLAQDVRFAATSAAPFFKSANWEFAPLGQCNMGVPFPRYVGGSNTTRLGVTRTNPADWRATRELWDALGYEKLLSPANRARISAGTPPLVDDAWIAVHPEDAGLVNEQIRMHHVLGLHLTVPLPVTRHMNAHMPGGFRYNPGGTGSQIPFYPLPPTE